MSFHRNQTEARGLKVFEVPRYRVAVRSPMWAGPAPAPFIRRRAGPSFCNLAFLILCKPRSRDPVFVLLSRNHFGPMEATRFYCRDQGVFVRRV